MCQHCQLEPFTVDIIIAGCYIFVMLSSMSVESERNRNLLENERKRRKWLGLLGHSATQEAPGFSPTRALAVRVGETAKI
ncbi:hypothetical protein SRHO_G00277590 [Serrasalmus rhombeus]